MNSYVRYFLSFFGFAEIAFTGFLQRENIIKCASSAGARLVPAVTKPAKEKSTTPVSKAVESGESRSKQAPVAPRPTLLATALADVNESDDSDSEYQTPSSDTAPPLFEGEGESHVTTPAMPRDGGSTASPRNASQAPASGRSSAATATGQSFVLSDAGCVDEESARAAGIPVVASRDFKAKQQERGPTPRRQWNRPQVSAHCFRRVIHHVHMYMQSY